MHTYIHTHISLRILIAPKWKPSRYPLVHESVSKRWHIHTKEDSAAIKRKKLTIYPTTGMNHKNTVLQEISQTQMTV